MSTTTTRVRVALAAATLVVALTGGIASAFAQSNGGGRGGGDSSGNGSSSGSAVLTYGTAGNCPPTLACGNPTPRLPHGKIKRARDVCGDYYRPGTVAYRQCLKGD